MIISLSYTSSSCFIHFNSNLCVDRKEETSTSLSTQQRVSLTTTESDRAKAIDQTNIRMTRSMKHKDGLVQGVAKMWIGDQKPT